MLTETIAARHRAQLAGEILSPMTYSTGPRAEHNDILVLQHFICAGRKVPR